MKILTQIKNIVMDDPLTSALVMANIALVVVSALYVFYTRGMVFVMKKDFDANNRPFVYASNITIDNNPAYVLRIALENSGKIPAKIKLTQAEMMPYEIGAEPQQQGNIDLSKMLNINHFAFPAQKNATISFPIINYINKILETDGFIFIIGFDYWSLSDTKNEKVYQYKAVINYRTTKGSYEGVIHDFQTMEAN